jgi:multicomponent Na+:H+ antiporter subunit G
MSTALSVFTIVAVALGAFFFLAGTVGLHRFPDTLTRLHALTKADNLGLGLIMLGMLPRVTWPFGAPNLVVVWILAMVASASASQLIARRFGRTAAHEHRRDLLRRAFAPHRGGG